MCGRVIGNVGVSSDLTTVGQSQVRQAFWRGCAKFGLNSRDRPSGLGAKGVAGSNPASPTNLPLFEPANKKRP